MKRIAVALAVLVALVLATAGILYAVFDLRIELARQRHAAHRNVRRRGRALRNARVEPLPALLPAAAGRAAARRGVGRCRCGRARRGGRHLLDRLQGPAPGRALHADRRAHGLVRAGARPALGRNRSAAATPRSSSPGGARSPSSNGAIRKWSRHMTRQPDASCGTNAWDAHFQRGDGRPRPAGDADLARRAGVRTRRRRRAAVPGRRLRRTALAPQHPQGRWHGKPAVGDGRRPADRGRPS